MRLTNKHQFNLQVEDIEAKLDLLLDLYKEDRKQQLQVIQHIAQQQEEMMQQHRRPLHVSSPPPAGPDRMPPEGGSIDAGATSTTNSSMYPYLPHLSHLTMDELKGQSEPSTPVLKTVKPPMHRNLSDLGPRFKKRVTYRCWSTINDSVERPPSVSSDEATPLTPILKKTNRDYGHHHNVRTHPTVEEVPTTTHTSPTQITTYVTSFCSSPPTNTQSSFEQTTAKQTQKYSPRSPNSPTSYPFVTSPAGGSTNSANQLQADQVSPNYYDTFVTSCEDSPPPKVVSPSSRDSSQEPYDYTRSTRFYTEDSGVSGGSVDLLTDSDPNSPVPGRFNQMYNSTESELISDGEDAGESTELLPLTPPSSSSSRSPTEAPSRQRHHRKVRRRSSGRSPTSPTSPVGAGAQLGHAESQARNSGRDREKYRRRPESQPLLMRPEVLKLRKTTC